MSQSRIQGTPRFQTGVSGLDDILAGGLPRHRVYLIQGEPGAGKTTLALQALLSAKKAGERGLYITLSESAEELHAVARSHAWSLDGVTIFELAIGAHLDLDDEDNTLYVPAEIELSERTQALLAEVDRVRPAVVVIDSCSELRLLAQSSLRFRRQVIGLKNELVKRACTVLLLDNPSGEGNELLQSLVHGVLHMEQLSPLYGAERRRLRVAKLREVAYRGGYHDFVIRHGGVTVFPRLIAAEHHEPFERSLVSSGVVELDKLLGGGLERGTAALFVGPSGSGKSALATQYVVQAARRGESSAMFVFDEGRESLFARSSGLGLELEQHVERGLVSVQQIDPAELSPGEFVGEVRRAVDQRNARLLVIDSLNGYLHAMPHEQFLLAHMHELLAYSRQQGLLSFLLVAQHGLVGSMSAPVDLSYLADTVLVTRYFEAGGRVRKALSALKKRTGYHEDTIRELSLSAEGIRVGPALTRFHGILTGVPEFDPSGKDALLEGCHG